MRLWVRVPLEVLVFFFCPLVASVALVVVLVVVLVVGSGFEDFDAWVVKNV